MRWFAAALLVCVAIGGCEGARPAPVTVRRCCGAGERLDSMPPHACHPHEAAEPWLPKIYAPARRDYLAAPPPHWQIAEHATPSCATPRLVPTDHTVPFVLLAANATLLLRREAANVSPADYCADAAGALVCLQAPAVARAPKCCPVGDAFRPERARCEPAPSHAARAASDLMAMSQSAAPGLGGGWPACEGGAHYSVLGPLSDARLSEDGALELKGTHLAAGAWCGEAVLQSGENESEVGVARVLACAGPGGAPPHHAFYGAGLALGAAFLAATLLAGGLLPAQHHALHARCQTRYVATLMLGDALLATTQIAGDSLPPVPCEVIAVCMHFLFLSAFFWLNTMCFNIWWTFRDFRPTSLERGQEARRLRLFRVYAWGAPLLLAGAACALDHWPGLPASVPRPRFAERACWFGGDAEALTYFFGPVGVLLLVNLALFASTARQLACGLWRRDDLKASAERAALGRVCAKLLVVMGVTWAADVLSWAAGGPRYLWYATDLLNALQGVFIFLVVGCQPPVWAAAKRVWARARGAPPPGSSHAPSCGDSLTHTTPAPASLPARRETTC